ncbi:hypothetical protein [Alterinioella nitratireducens]|jgi:hypothetical protein|uniref:hypothetical protein n=1 Tax=Alterinioella nitratireducens TaxID=2735915 RepID=UPI0015553BA1|nr:hypothetical protein [Alterinioella nitratireducens]NPD18579.1 hypothetical protein [Alterinioella nitratireducens]
MKTLTLTTALIATLAAPAFAAANPVAEAIFAAERASQQELTLTERSSGDAGMLFLSEARSNDELTTVPADIGTEVISTQSFGTNATAARIFAEQRAMSLEDE